MDGAIERRRKDVAAKEDREPRGGRLVESMAVAVQGALAVGFAPPAVADAFCASRLGGDWGRVLGTLPAGAAFDEIIALGRIGQG